MIVLVKGQSYTLPKPTTGTPAVAKITPRMDEVVRNNSMSHD